MGLFRRRNRATAQTDRASASPTQAGDQGSTSTAQTGPSAERRAELEGDVADLTERLSTEEDAKRRIEILNSLGAACAELGEDEAAIGHYEASMAVREQFGPAYNGLLVLYNDQLRASAQAKDDAGIQRWTTRLDELMALSKRVMRSNY